MPQSAEYRGSEFSTSPREALLSRGEASSPSRPGPRAGRDQAVSSTSASGPPAPAGPWRPPAARPQAPSSLSSPVAIRSKAALGSINHV